MSEPLRINCQNFDTIPSIDEIRKLVSKDVHLVLQFPRSIEPSDLSPIISKLSIQLHNYSVFFSGLTKESINLTVTKVIDEELILANTELFLQAINSYLKISDELILELAKKLNCQPEEISIDWLYQIKSLKSNVELEEHWGYLFHGRECRFRNSATGQVVDMRLKDYGNKEAIPDPYFLAEYIQTTSTQVQVSALLNDNFHDMRRVLDILESTGHLKRE